VAPIRIFAAPVGWSARLAAADHLAEGFAVGEERRVLPHDHDRAEPHQADHAEEEADALIGIAMATETVYLVQAYVAGKGRTRLRAEPAVGCKTAEEARRKAERLGPLRLGVIAYSVSADVEMGDYDETPILLFKTGQLPPPFDEL
jgi:hypothetical protein